jgi:FADH2-dependent halogenase
MVDTRDNHYDAIVIGGGPSGSAYAITLTRSGRSVLVLERSAFPRFHVGESLLPYTADMLKQLGLLEKVGSSGFPIKRGLELLSSDGFLRRAPLGEIGDGFRKWTFQVERSDFDKILLDTAAERGAEVLREAKVTELLFTGERVSGVRFQHDGDLHTATAEYVIDASGRAGVIARGLNLRSTDAHLKMAAVLKHYRHDERSNPGVPWDTQIGVHENGWVWAIPIRKDLISIGAMAPAELLRQNDPQQVFDAALERLPRIKQRIDGATIVRDISGENNFEYHCDTLAGPGYFIIGDAGCFSDPVFSAGVLLALATGKRAAVETINVMEGKAAEEEAGLTYQNFFKTGYETYYRLIRAVYDNRCPVMGQFITQMFMEEKIPEKWRVRTLNGDFWTTSNPFVNRLRREPNWDLFAPFEPLYGCPVYANGSDLSFEEAEGPPKEWDIELAVA